MSASRVVFNGMCSILVLERDELIRELISEWLLEAGYAVEVGDPRLARRANPVDDNPRIIIADICMPKDQGVEKIRTLKLAYPCASIIAISGRFCSGLRGSAQAAQQLGVYRVLSKPFTREDLLDAVRSLIHMPGKPR